MMVSPDLINASFEVLAGGILTLNCWRLFKDKVVKGISPISVIFFTSWGVWNLYYYPYLSQPLSFWGGILVVGANGVWIVQMVYYTWAADFDQTPERTKELNM